MSTENLPQDPSRSSAIPSGNDPLKSAALVPEDPFTEPPAGPATTSDTLAGQHVLGTVPVSGSSGATDAQDTKTAAKEEARQLGHEGAETAKQVGHTAKQEAGKVAHEAKAQVRGLVDELGSDLRSQAGAQQQKVAQGLRSMSDELRSMAKNSEGSGTATSLVDQAAGKAGDVADWLDGRDPGSLLEEVKGFARRRPGVFLAVAAGAGLLAGRLARGMTGQDSATGNTSTGYTGGTAGVRTPAQPVRPPTETYPLAETYPASDTGFESPTETGARSIPSDVGGPERFPADTDRGYPRP